MVLISLSGLTAIVIDQTNTMPDVYGAFYDFACMMKPKVVPYCLNRRKKAICETLFSFSIDLMAVSTYACNRLTRGILMLQRHWIGLRQS